MNRFIDETGHVYGKLTVIEFDEEKRKWLCQCECGNVVYHQGGELRANKYKSCGCSHYQRQDITGKKFGQLIAIKFDEKKKKWLCQCVCGNTTYADIKKLNNGRKVSCGCGATQKFYLLKKDKRFKRLYTIYNGIVARCYNSHCREYKFYGGRGIKMCDEWYDKENGFFRFFDWAIKNGYMDLDVDAMYRLSIDRIDSNKDYCPENCRWIPLYENINRSLHDTLKKEKIEELISKSEDELVSDYYNRKMKLQEEKMGETSKTSSKGNFFYRKPNYCILHNTDNTKQFLFRNFKTVAFFLEITSSAISYRFRKKEGVITKDWKLEKIDKEQYDFYVNKGIEVIK